MSEMTQKLMNDLEITSPDQLTTTPIQESKSDGGTNEDASPTSNNNLVILFPLKNEPGALARILNIFDENKVNISRIESRRSKQREGEYEVIVELETSYGHLAGAIFELKEETEGRMEIVEGATQKFEANPWFPRKMQDLNRLSPNPHVSTHRDKLDEDHPRFTDPVYLSRRQELGKLAANYKIGQTIPEVEYTSEEIETWGKVYRQLTTLHPTYACRKFLENFSLLVKECGFREDDIPQLQNVSEYLKKFTGFTLKPATGILTWRDFLSGFAYRVIHATQYIRHPSKPFHSPEPDICHELLGHLPLFMDPEFATFAQEIGLASLGATDETIDKLSTCLWFTIEIGLCREDDQIKVYGAALLSSYGALEHSMSSKPELRPFDPETICIQPYSTGELQPLLCVAENFRDATDKLLKFTATLERPFKIRYQAETSTVEILDPRK